jgi:putative hemolysin
MSTWAWFGIGAVALGFGGILSALAQALRDLSRSTLLEYARQRPRPDKVERIERINADVEGHAAAIGLPRILLNLVLAAAAVFWLAAARDQAVPDWIDVAGGLAIASVLVWVFGLVIPHAVAKHAGEPTVYAWSALLRLAYVGVGPLRLVVRFFDEVVRRLSGKPVDDNGSAIQQELLDVVEEGAQEGQFDRVERNMIGAIVRFKDTTVAQIMTPRTEIEAMELTNNLGAVVAQIRAGGHSRIPVYEHSLDHIVGIFYVKDLLRWLAGDGMRGGKSFDLKHIVRPAMFVPETKTVRELLGELIEKKVHVAMVADEYGGTSGLVSFEDIIEQIVGEIQDEYEQPNDAAPDIDVRPEARSAEVDARAYIKDTNEALRRLGIELPESEDYDTVAGFVTLALGTIPGVGQTLREGPLLITVLGAEPTRVTRVKIERVDGAPPAEDENQAGADAEPKPLDTETIRR